MAKKQQTRSRTNKATPPKDLPVGRRATKVKAGVRVTVDRSFVKSWSVSGDA